MYLFVKKLDGSFEVWNSELAVGTMVVAGVEPIVAKETVRTGEKILRELGVAVVPTVTWVRLSEEIRRGNLAEAVKLARPLPKVAPAAPVAAGPAAQMNVVMDPKPHLLVQTHLRPEHAGRTLLITAPAHRQPVLVPVLPKVGLHTYSIPIGLGEIEFGFVYQARFLGLDGAILPPLATSVYVAPLILFGLSAAQTLQQIHRLEETIDELAELRRTAVENHPWGAALILYEITRRWSELLQRIPPEVWLGAALFVLCHDEAVAGLTAEQLRHVLEIMQFNLEMEIAALDLKDNRTPAQDAKLASLRAAKARVDAALDTWDDDQTQEAALDAVRGLKAWLRENAQDALTALASGFGVFAVIKLVSREILFAAAYLVACDDQYIGALENAELKLLLELLAANLQLAIGQLEALPNRDASEESRLNALRAAKQRVDDALENWDDDAAAEQMRELLRRIKLQVGAEVLAALVEQLGKFAVDNVDKIPAQRFLVTQLIKFILRRVLGAAAQKILGPLDVALALFDLGQTIMVVDDVNAIDDMLHHMRWLKAELLTQIPELAFPATGTEGKHALVLPKARCAGIDEIRIKAIIRCATKDGDDVDWNECELKVRRPDGEPSDEIAVPADEFDEPGPDDPEGSGCIVPYMVILESDCIEGAELCYVSAIVTIKWKDGSTSTHRIMINAKDYR